VRLAQWRLVTNLMAVHPDAEVWIGLSRVMSVDEVGKAFGSLTAHAVLVVYEQRQGTYLKGQERITAVRIDDASFGGAADAVLQEALSPSNAPRIGSPNAFDPVDESVVAGHAPIGGLLVSGQVGTVVAAQKCLVYSMATSDTSGMVSISPAIEPEKPNLTAGQ
jgi:hypothetical protein